MDENARKRKREEERELSDVESIAAEDPKEELKNGGKKRKQPTKSKKDKRQEGYEDGLDSSEIAKEKAEKRREKRREKKEKAKEAKVKQREKKKRRTKRFKQGEEGQDQADEKGDTPGVEENKEIKADKERLNGDVQFQAKKQNAPDVEDDEEEIEDIDVEGIEDPKAVEPSSEVSSAPPSKAPSPSFDLPQNQSGISSISSLATQNAASEDKPAKRPKLEVKVDQEELRARLQKRVAELRAARKADNPDGTPARTRSELIEMRRKKEEEKKKNKKALRQQAKEEERRQKEIALARGSPLLSPSGASPAGAHGQSPLSDPANNFSYGRIAFNNGETMTASLNAVIDPHRRKGPQDPHTALQAAKKKTERLNAMDSEKRADIEEKDMWLNAKKRAQGERVHDNTSLLKKALKRKDKQKKKSEKEWNERIQGVAQGQAARQKKREENLAKRKEGKGSKGGAKKSKKKARPGFEGSFKTGR